MSYYPSREASKGSAGGDRAVSMDAKLDQLLRAIGGQTNKISALDKNLRLQSLLQCLMNYPAKLSSLMTVLMSYRPFAKHQCKIKEFLRVSKCQESFRYMQLRS